MVRYFFFTSSLYEHVPEIVGKSLGRGVGYPERDRGRWLRDYKNFFSSNFYIILNKPFLMHLIAIVSNSKCLNPDLIV